jgi:siroheme synthase-like protein
MNLKESKQSFYYPIFLNLEGKKCVVVGGGKVALRKIKILLDCRAHVFVISPTSHPEITKLSKRKAIHWIPRAYKAGDLKNAVITLACTDMKSINRKVAEEARKSGIPVNVADDPEQSDFITPSFFKRGNLMVAVSTSGVSPALARKLRTMLEKSFGEEYASLLSLIGEVRSMLKEKGQKVGTEAWQKALDLDLLIQLMQIGQTEKAKTILLNKLKGHQLKSV